MSVKRITSDAPRPVSLHQCSTQTVECNQLTVETCLSLPLQALPHCQAASTAKHETCASCVVLFSCIFKHLPLSMFLALSGTASLSGCLHAIRGVWHEDGIRGFYRGCATNLCRTTPAAALTFTRCEGFQGRVQEAGGVQGCFLLDSVFSSSIQEGPGGRWGAWEGGQGSFYSGSVPHHAGCSAHIHDVRGFPGWYFSLQPITVTVYCSGRTAAGQCSVIN